MSEAERIIARAAEHEGSPTGLTASPAKHLAVLACMDARLDPIAVLGLEPGDAHVIRNAGGVVTEDAIRSLMLSQQLLGTEEIILIHHTNCGLEGRTDEQVHDLVEQRTGTRPAFPIETFEVVEDSVRRSLERLRATPFVKDQRLSGFVYEVDTGRLRKVE
ncbi:MAG: carbonic anhydrase [Actinomycetota bacterium]